MALITDTVIDFQIDDRVLARRPEPCIDKSEVFLSPLHRDNFHTLHRWVNNKTLSQEASEVPFKPERFGAFLKRLDEMAYRPSLAARDYEIHVSNRALVGVAYINCIHYIDRWCRVGVTICDLACRGKGYGRATLELLLRHLFCDCGFHRVEAEAYNFQDAWKHLLMSSGFELKSRLPRYLLRDGDYWDKIIFMMQRSEYTPALSMDNRTG